MAKIEIPVPFTLPTAFISIDTSSVSERLGLHTESPFTQTRAKRLASKLRMGLEEERNEIRDRRSTAKKVEWRSQAMIVEVSALTEMPLRNAEELMHDKPEEFDILKKAVHSVALISSDATQGEIDFLTGKSKEDPRPMHKINYGARNPQDRGVIVEFPPYKKPRFGFKRETTGEARHRVLRQSNTLDASQELSGIDIDSKEWNKALKRYIKLKDQISIDRYTGKALKPLERKTEVIVFGKKIPLPPKRERLSYDPHIFNRGH